MEEIKKQASDAVKELLESANLKKGDVFIIGCSSSEISGSVIGKGSDSEAAEAVFDAVYPLLKEKGIFLAAQCCEHLNRAVVLEREAAEKYGFEEVSVVPWEHAGGAFATTVFRNLDHPVVVEHIKASAGIDIGQTLIGMHLKHVAVPVRLSVKNIGHAVVTAARTRPKYIGGSKARYE